MSKLAEIQTALKVPKNQRNEFGGYSYRSCEDILESLKPLLGEATILLNDEIVKTGDRYYVKATATLSSDGEQWQSFGWAREAESRKGMDDSQITGSASSYARKYALNGLFGIDDAKDADATNDHGNPEADKNSIKPITSAQIKQAQGFFESFEADKDQIQATVDKFSGGRVTSLDAMMKNEAAAMITALNKKHCREFAITNDAHNPAQ